VGDFKKEWILELVSAGYLVDFAYGNAPTDIYAYLSAEIDPASVWIIGDNGGQMGTQAAGNDWTERVSEVESLERVMQPFKR
jgi:hypothetical protein